MQRQQREEKDFVVADQLFSPWYVIMIPTPSWLVHKLAYTSYIPRSKGHSGYRLKRLENTEIPSEPGLYEFRLFHVSDSYAKTVVYVGHSGKDLRRRIAQYCRSGSHKASWINRALRAGFAIEMRYRKVLPRKPPKGTPSSGWDSYKDAEELERVFLNHYDYLWNSSDNGGVRIQNYKFYDTATHLPSPGKTLQNIAWDLRVRWIKVNAILACFVGISAWIGYMLGSVMALSIAALGILLLFVIN